MNLITGEKISLITWGFFPVLKSIIAFSLV